MTHNWQSLVVLVSQTWWAFFRHALITLWNFRLDVKERQKREREKPKHTDILVCYPRRKWLTWIGYCKWDTILQFSTRTYSHIRFLCEKFGMVILYRCSVVGAAVAVAHSFMWLRSKSKLINWLDYISRAIFRVPWNRMCVKRHIRKETNLWTLGTCTHTHNYMKFHLNFNLSHCLCMFWLLRVFFLSFFHSWLISSCAGFRNIRIQICTQLLSIVWFCDLLKCNVANMLTEHSINVHNNIMMLSDLRAIWPSTTQEC